MTNDEVPTTDYPLVFKTPIPPTIKSGDKVLTPDGEGIIVDFEIQPPLKSKMPTYYIHHLPLTQLAGEYIRCGVSGCHTYISVAYYPLNQINQDPQL